MFVLAYMSFNDRCWPVILGSVFLAALLGFLLRSPKCGFYLGGLAGAVLTIGVLGSSPGDLVGLATAIATPIHATIAGLVGCFFGWIGLARGPKSPPSAGSGPKDPHEA